jgi:hypothetical protein
MKCPTCIISHGWDGAFDMKPTSAEVAPGPPTSISTIFTCDVCSSRIVIEQPYTDLGPTP